MTENNSIICCC